MSEFIEADALHTCINYLQDFEQDGTALESKVYISLCRMGLQAIFANFEAYQKNLASAVPILACFKSHLKKLAACAAEKDARRDEGFTERLNDLCFELLEETAVLIREKHLREGCRKPSPEEKAVMDYFESSGIWYIGDNTLVTDYYYVKVPIAVLGGLLKRLEFPDAADAPEEGREKKGKRAGAGGKNRRGGSAGR